MVHALPQSRTTMRWWHPSGINGWRALRLEQTPIIILRQRRTPSTWGKSDLSFNSKLISYYVINNGMVFYFKGPVAFHGLYGVFYPAVSVNRGVAVTLHTALDAPCDIDDC